MNDHKPFPEMFHYASGAHDCLLFWSLRAACNALWGLKILLDLQKKDMVLTVYRQPENAASIYEEF